MGVVNNIWKIARRIISGDILSTFKVGHYIPQISCVVLMLTLSIIIGIFIDATLSNVEKNKQRIEELKIELAVKTRIYSSQRKLENIEATLQSGGIDIHIPDKPATRIKD